MGILLKSLEDIKVEAAMESGYQPIIMEALTVMSISYLIKSMAYQGIMQPILL